MTKRYRALRHTLGYYALRLVILLIRLVPVSVGRWLFRSLGFLLSRLSTRDIQRLHKNLTAQFPTKTPEEIRSFSREIYGSLGVSFFDGVKLPWLAQKSYDKRVQLHNGEAFDKALALGKGAIVLSGHVSAFELQTQTVAHAGFPIFTVGANQFDHRVDDLLARLRQRNGVGYLPRDGAARPILRQLRKNRIFGVLIDQDATDDGVFAPFLGTLAYTPSAPMQMALAFDIPVLYAFMHRDNAGVYHLTIEGPVALQQSENPKEALVKNIARFNEAYGKHILEYPEQWVWMHRRWKRKRDEYPTTPATTDF